MATIQELHVRRTKIEGAIEEIYETGQSYQVGSRKVTRADLSTLESMLQRVEAQIAAAEATRGLLPNTFAARFEGR